MDNIKTLIQEIKAFKQEANNNGQASLVLVAESMLNFIEYAKADSIRLNYLSDNPQLLNIKTRELRGWIDNQIKESA